MNIKQAIKQATRPNGKALNNNGVIIYRGASMLDGEPIVAVLTGIATPSTNPKTGKMYQVYILVDNGLTPIENHQSGLDYAVCGDCPLRGQYDASGVYIRGTRICYVNIGQAPRSVIACLNDGGYLDISEQPELITEVCENQNIRGGSYGDPAAVPEYVWALTFDGAASHTAYTHQWSKKGFEWLKQYAMASTDTASQALGAAALGWRYFRLATDATKLQGVKEVVCPSTTVGLACEKCKACDGMTGGRLASIVIPVHGSGAVAFKAAL